MSDEKSQIRQRTLIWDIPTRVFHWLLVFSFAGAYLTAESEMSRAVHVAFGYTMAGLIAFRLVWGFCGTRYARFSSFLFKPAEIIAYCRSLIQGKPRHYLGHNPAGSIAIWLLLGLGVSSIATGICSFEDVGGERIKELHEGFSVAMLLVVVVHVLGVFVSSLLHRENLVVSMITGLKSALPSEGITQPYVWLGVVMVIEVAAFWLCYPVLLFGD